MALSRDPPIPPGEFDATAYCAAHDDPGVTPAQVLAGFPASTRGRMAAVEARLDRNVATELVFRVGGDWTEARRQLHAGIIDHVLSDARIAAATPREGAAPRFIILGGRGGSGKSWFAGRMFDPETAIVLDADAIKQRIPEYEGWNAGLVHAESGDLFDQVTRIAADLGLNIVHDSTMKTRAKALRLVKDFKALGYRVEAHYMHLPRHLAARRAVERFLGPSGRYVPVAVVLGNTGNEASFESIRGLVDSWSFWDNNVERGQAPRLISESGHEDDAGADGRHGQPAADRAGGRQPVEPAPGEDPAGAGRAAGRRP